MVDRFAAFAEKFCADMRNESVSASGPSDVSGVALGTVWDVEANDSYDVPGEMSVGLSRILNPVGGDTVIAVRTLSGGGRVYLRGVGSVELRGNSLFLMEQRRLERYHTLLDNWNFWWFEFRSLGALHLPLHEVLELGGSEGEVADFKEILERLGDESVTSRRYASSCFLKLLHWWGLDVRVSNRRARHREKIIELIEKMQKSPRGWTVRGMAAEAQMSEGRFRVAFQGLTGMGPKRFYDLLRLRVAEEYLRFGMMNVKEVAFLMGYCDSFQFSKAFRKYFGYTPSEVNGK